MGSALRCLSHVNSSNMLFLLTLYSLFLTFVLISSFLCLFLYLILFYFITLFFNFLILFFFHFIFLFLLSTYLYFSSVIFLSLFSPHLFACLLPSCEHAEENSMNLAYLWTKLERTSPYTQNTFWSFTKGLGAFLTTSLCKGNSNASTNKSEFRRKHVSL